MHTANTPIDNRLSRMAKRLAVLAVFDEGNKKLSDYGWYFLTHLGRITIPSTYKLCDEFSRLPPDDVVDTVETIYKVALHNLEINAIENPYISRLENLQIAARVVTDSFSLKHEINCLDTLAIV